MDITEVFEVINRMHTQGVIQDYAIGGAVGATFYLEPISTLDVDIFVSFQAESQSVILDPQPVFEYLKSQGYFMQGEYVMIGGWPVQFLPPNSKLVEAAMVNANSIQVAGTTTRVFSAEYLAAIALETGRAKDKARLLQFVESGTLDKVAFDDIIKEQSLVEKWKVFSKQFLEETP